MCVLPYSRAQKALEYVDGEVIDEVVKTQSYLRQDMNNKTSRSETSNEADEKELECMKGNAKTLRQ
jgi:hypothetical protein